MEESLIILCKRGDQKAQRMLYDRYCSRMFRLCYRYLQNQMDAEDILINGFVKIFEHFKNLEHRSNESTEAWMKTIMVNECLMFLRKRKVLFYAPENIGEHHLITLPLDDMEVEEIYTVILKLPTGYRTVFNLYVIEGYNHKEIAAQLGISENTSKSQLHKAKAMLQQILTREGMTNGK